MDYRDFYKKAHECSSKCNELYELYLNSTYIDGCGKRIYDKELWRKMKNEKRKQEIYTRLAEENLNKIISG